MSVDVVDYLRQKYERRGADFYFRCRHIARRFGVTSQLVAVRVARAMEKGEPIIIANNPAHSEKLYRTTFGEKK